MEQVFTEYVTAEIVVDGEFYTAYFTRVTKTSTDSNYGADADGRRGTKRTFIEEDIFEDLSVDGIEIDALEESDRVEYEKAVEGWMRENEPKLQD